MRDLDADHKKWEELHTNWVFANQEARRARLAITGKYAACANGTGTGPTIAELEQVERLEKAADEASLASSGFIREVFGKH